MLRQLHLIPAERWGKELVILYERFLQVSNSLSREFLMCSVHRRMQLWRRLWGLAFRLNSLYHLIKLLMVAMPSVHLSCRWVRWICRCPDGPFLLACSSSRAFDCNFCVQLSLSLSRWWSDGDLVLIFISYSLKHSFFSLSISGRLYFLTLFKIGSRPSFALLLFFFRINVFKVALIVVD